MWSAFIIVLAAEFPEFLEAWDNALFSISFSKNS